MPSSISSPASPADAGARVALALREVTGPAGAPFLRDVSLSVPGGEVHLLLGAIHSGKTLLLRHLVGLERAERGTVAVGDLEVDLAAPDPAALRALRRRIGVLFAGSALLRRIPAIDNVELPLLEHSGVGARDAREAARALLAEVGLSLDDDATPDDLDRSAQRRVALARALALGPEVLLLDEPTAGLDPHAAHELDELVLSLQRARGFGVLVLSHEVRYAFAIAHQVTVLAGGRVIAAGPRDALLASRDPELRRIFHRRSNA